MKTFIELQQCVEKEDKKITVSEARECFGGCIPGWKLFAETYNFDWVTVRKQGLLASELLQTQDTLALELLNFCYRD